MAMVADAFISLFVDRLAALVESEIAMLLGVDADLLALQSRLRSFHSLLSDAESKRISDRSVSDWLARLRDLMYDADDLLDDCRAAAEGCRAATSRKGFVASVTRCFVPFRHEVGKRIARINEDLKRLEEETRILGLVAGLGRRDAGVWTPPMTSPLIVEEDIVGIDQDAADLVGLLTGATGRKCPIYAITGMPGIGKTTLAQKIFNDPDVKSHFQLMFWICVSKEYQYVDLLKQIARNAVQNNGTKDKREIYGDANTRAELDSIVKVLVDGKRYLLVLDDVWDGDIWEELRKPLYSGGNESRLLITTRNNDVAKKIGADYIHPARQLSDKECWVMLCKVIFNDKPSEQEIKILEETGKEIAKKCKGLPLSVKTIGGLLKTKEKSVAAWDEVRKSPIWQFKGLKDDIEPGLLLSYEDLPSHLKQCLIYCSLFPEDFRFHQHYLVQMWIAEGFIKGDEELEELGEMYYKELVTRNLLQPMPDYYNGKGCTIHDLVRVLARHASQNEYTCGDPHMLHSTRQRHLSFVDRESSVVPSIIREQEYMRTLLLSRNPMITSIPSEYFEKLGRLRVLDLTYTGIESLPDSLGNLIHLRFLNVAFTKLKALPETINKLKNLETLKANGLKFLVKLPAGIVQLINLRHLTVGSTFTQLKEMPAGIAGLTKLRTLDGFVANNGAQSNIKELGDLHNLTSMSMYKLERIARQEDASGAMLGNKSKLTFLRLSCTRKPNGHQFTEGNIKRIEGVFEGLSPPKSIDGIVIESFFGRELPSWIRNPSLNTLTWLRLDDCKFVKQLPPLGRLPELRVAHVWNLTAVSDIGPDFFCGAKGFPKLFELYLLGLNTLTTISGLENGALCCLKKLHIIKCQRLVSLPDGLQHAANLSKLVIEDCKSITTIKNHRKVNELKLSGNTNLKSILDFPSLTYMSIDKCPVLADVMRVDELSQVFLSDVEMLALPNWLSQIRSLKRLDVRGSAELVARCLIRGEDWHKIENISHLEARSLNGSSYVSYRKEPHSFQSNLSSDTSEDLLSARTLSRNEIAEGGYSSHSLMTPFC